PKKTFRVAGIFEYSGGRDSIGGEQEVAFIEPVAQELMLGKTGGYNVIEVKVADKPQLNKGRDAIPAERGADYQVDSGKDLAKQQTDSIKKSLSYFTYILVGFAVVAGLVGIFLILNTFSIIVAQRTQELALMRSMGASRRQVL